MPEIRGHKAVKLLKYPGSRRLALVELGDGGKGRRAELSTPRLAESDGSAGEWLRESAGLQRELAAESPHWQPVLEIATDRGVPQVLTPETRKSVQWLLERAVQVKHRRLYGIVRQVLSGLAHLNKSHGRGHGDLTAADIVLSASAPGASKKVQLRFPAASSRVPADSMALDLRRLGELILLLADPMDKAEGVETRIAALKRIYGPKQGAEWGRFCTELLESGELGTVASASEALKLLAKLRPTSRIWAAGGVLLLTAAVAVGGMMMLRGMGGGGGNPSTPEQLTQYQKQYHGWFGGVVEAYREANEGERASIAKVLDDAPAGDVTEPGSSDKKLAQLSSDLMLIANDAGYGDLEKATAWNAAVQARLSVARDVPDRVEARLKAYCNALRAWEKVLDAANLRGAGDLRQAIGEDRLAVESVLNPATGGGAVQLGVVMGRYPGSAWEGPGAIKELAGAVGQLKQEVSTSQVAWDGLSQKRIEAVVVAGMGSLVEAYRKDGGTQIAGKARELSKWVTEVADFQGRFGKMVAEMEPADVAELRRLTDVTQAGITLLMNTADDFMHPTGVDPRVKVDELIAKAKEDFRDRQAGLPNAQKLVPKMEQIEQQRSKYKSWSKRRQKEVEAGCAELTTKIKAFRDEVAFADRDATTAWNEWMNKAMAGTVDERLTGYWESQRKAILKDVKPGQREAARQSVEALWKYLETLAKDPDLGKPVETRSLADAEGAKAVDAALAAAQLEYLTQCVKELDWAKTGRPNDAMVSTAKEVYRTREAELKALVSDVADAKQKLGKPTLEDPTGGAQEIWAKYAKQSVTADGVDLSGQLLASVAGQCKDLAAIRSLPHAEAARQAMKRTSDRGGAYAGWLLAAMGAPVDRAKLGLDDLFDAEAKLVAHPLLAGNYAAQKKEIWLAYLQLAGTDELIGKVLGVRKQFGDPGDGEIADMNCRYNVVLWKQKKQIEEFLSRGYQPDDKVKEAASVFVAAFTQMKVDAAMRPNLGAITSASAGKSPKELGPGSTNDWAGEMVGDGDVLFKGSSGQLSTQSMTFHRVSPKDGRPFFLCETETPIGLVLAYMADPARHRAVAGHFATDSGFGPHIWKRDSDDGIVLATAWLDSDPVLKDHTPLPAGWDEGRPDRDYPAQMISAAGASIIAGWSKCRLPTVSEYEAAVGDASDLKRWHVRGSRWPELCKHIADLKADPTHARFPQYPVQRFCLDGNCLAATQADCLEVDNGRVWFFPVDKGGDPTSRFKHLLGNVAEFTTVSAEGPPEYRVFGPSCMSAPKVEIRAVGPKQQFIDVGFRLCFDEEGDPLINRLRDAIKALPYRTAK